MWKFVEVCGSLFFAACAALGCAARGQQSARASAPAGTT